MVIILEKRPDEQYSKFKIKIEPSGILIEPDKGVHEQQRLCPADRKCFIYGLMMLRGHKKGRPRSADNDYSVVLSTASAILDAWSDTRSRLLIRSRNKIPDSVLQRLLFSR